MHFKIAIAAVLIVLVAAVIFAVASGTLYRSGPKEVASALLVPDGCYQIEGGIVCYINGYWQPQCYWGYRAIFPLKRCVVGRLR